MESKQQLKRKKKKLKREERRRDGAEYLKALPLKWIEKNGGYHFIVEAQGKKYDLWPSTDKWMEQGGIKSQSGVRELLLNLMRQS
jgi:hypothetical protein